MIKRKLGTFCIHHIPNFLDYFLVHGYHQCHEDEITKHSVPNKLHIQFRHCDWDHFRVSISQFTEAAT